MRLEKFKYFSVLPLFVTLCCISATRAGIKPNFIIIFTDDQGYNDLGCFGSKNIETPNIDRMAEEGRRFTSFYVPANICTPSRAALMTGCYPKRVDMEKGVIFPSNNHGLHPDEVTIAEVLKKADYATACIGKWHLGHWKEFLPTSQGFDSYYGIPYSNDMSHPDNSNRSNCRVWTTDDEGWKKWHTPLMQDEKIIELPVNQKTITRRYTDRAIEFIEKNSKKPFFLYLAHSMPHVPLFVPDDRFNPDKKKAYITVIEHIDDEVGRILETVKKLELTERTYIIYTSDNGPWLKFGSLGGCAKPLRGGKTTTYDGGHRVPCVMRGPGIPAGTSTDEIASTIDLLPTMAKLAGAEIKSRGPIDGLDISELIKGKGESARKQLLFYAINGKLEGIRQGKWKARKDGRKQELYNLQNDIAEKNNLANKMPGKFEELMKLAHEKNKELARNKRPRGQHGK